MTRREVLTIKVEEALTDYLMLQRADAFVGFINELIPNRNDELKVNKLHHEYILVAVKLNQLQRIRKETRALTKEVNEYWVDKDNKLNAKEEKEDK